MSIEDKVNKSGPHKLLAIDGGGMRNLISLELLGEIEHLLQQTEGSGDSFVLADYFDYIAGSSSGAIVASCLALGMRVDQVKEFFLSRTPQLFNKAFILQRYKYLYEPGPLLNNLRRYSVAIRPSAASD